MYPLGCARPATPRHRSAWADARLLDVLADAGDITILAHLPGYAPSVPVRSAKPICRDGLILYLVLVRPLYQRPGSPYVRPDGSDWANNAVSCSNEHQCRFASRVA
jgi:starch synthase